VNVILVSVVIVGAIMGANSGGLGMGTGSSFAAGVVQSVLTAAIYLGYFAYLESSRGQTVGKMLLKLETRGPGGGRPTMEQAVKRNAFTAIGLIGIIPILGWFLSPLLSLVAFIMIAVTINNDNVNRQGWHDKFAGGTSVIKIG
ncbi:MAG TPA: RDD family protein, partial [Nocardioidaceae bacterium]|nr:RDD family protein [Nocardioidaceae bacterium]